MIAENFIQVKRRIIAAAKRAGRDQADVRIVAVSKGFSTVLVAEGIQAGAQVFGENKVQEARAKIESLGHDVIEWHFIGHLQKNKVKFIFDLFDLIHSVDSLALAVAINEKAEILGSCMPILLQVNVSGEASKFGIDPKNVMDVIREVAPLKGLKVRGLMTITPYNSNPEKSRPYYVRLRYLRDTYSRTAVPGVSLDELSMGMSNDYEVAVEEGATLVRVGTALFGPRPSKRRGTIG